MKAGIASSVNIGNRRERANNLPLALPCFFCIPFLKKTDIFDRKDLDLACLFFACCQIFLSSLWLKCVFKNSHFSNLVAASSISALKKFRQDKNEPNMFKTGHTCGRVLFFVRWWTFCYGWSMILYCCKFVLFSNIMWGILVCFILGKVSWPICVYVVCACLYVIRCSYLSWVLGECHCKQESVEVAWNPLFCSANVPFRSHLTRIIVSW